MGRYWEVEEEDKNDIESELCENEFTATLGDSKNQAMVRFVNERNEKLRVYHTNFMNKYMDLGHMVKGQPEGKYFLRHQAVIRDASLTTKLRVVFEASV